MPRKTAAPRRKTAPTQTAPPQQQQPYYTYSMPSPQRRGIGSVILIILLIALSFFSGYLLSRVQSLERGNAGAGAQPPDAAPQAPPLNLKEMPAVTDKDHIRGSLDADVILVEYTDLECPFCKSFHPTLQQVQKEYGGKVAWVFRHFPLAFHQNAQKEAEASECVAELGGNDAFWSFVDAIFERTTSDGTGFALDKLGPLAAEVGVDQSKFQECLDSGKYAQKVKDQMDGGARAGVNGTPGTIIVGKNDKRDYISGALGIEDVKKQIDAALK